MRSLDFNDPTNSVGAQSLQNSLKQGGLSRKTQIKKGGNSFLEQKGKDKLGLTGGASSST